MFSVIKSNCHVACKPYRCSLCNSIIPAGTEYVRVVYTHNNKLSYVALDKECLNRFDSAEDSVDYILNNHNNILYDDLLSLCSECIQVGECGFKVHSCPYIN